VTDAEVGAVSRIDEAGRTRLRTRAVAVRAGRGRGGAVAVAAPGGRVGGPTPERRTLDQRLHGIPGDLDPFSHRPGTFSCHIHYPVRELRHLVGSCTTAMRMQGGQAAEVSFIERWQPRACRHGCSVRLSWRSHLWRVRESDDGWQVAISSSGDPPPQFPNGVSRSSDRARCSW